MYKLGVLALALALVVVANAADDKYTTKYDNINLDEILNNDRLYSKYLDCLKTGNKCTPDGKTLKDALPDALQTGCSKCSDKQKQGTEKVIKHLINNKPQDYAALEKLYDPQGLYKKKFPDEAKKLGITA